MKHIGVLTIIFFSVFSCVNKMGEKNIALTSDGFYTNNTLFVSKTTNLIEFECPKFEFKTYKAQADSIVKFFETAKLHNDDKKLEFETLFFCSFPNSFDEMENIFGFYSETGEPGPLYDYSGGPEGANKDRGVMSFSIIRYFANLKSIPSERYYDKFVNICVNGTWQADNITAGFYIYERLENDTKSICNVLSKKTKKEVYSVFKFIFDGPHPDNEYNDEIFDKIYPLISNENIELGDLLKMAYTDLLKESKHKH